MLPFSEKKRNPFRLNASLQHPSKNTVKSGQTPGDIMNISFSDLSFSLFHPSTIPKNKSHKPHLRFNQKLHKHRNISISRAETPHFPNKQSSSIGYSNNLCERLIEDQDYLKLHFSKQKVQVKKLKADNASENFPPLVNQRKESISVKRYSTKTKVKTANPERIRETQEPTEAFRSKTSLKTPYFGEYSLMLFNRLEKFSEQQRNSPKYYKDRPKIHFDLRFPKEVFSPK